MKKILVFLGIFALWCDCYGAVGRGDTVSVRQGASTQRVTTAPGDRANGRSAIPVERGTMVRNASERAATQTRSARSNVVSRAATNAVAGVSETRVGADYERCKTAFFTCMDQFCALKNDDYRRCSCSARVDGLADAIAGLQDAKDQLTTFTDRLDVVGMTAAQAKAMRTESDGESALTSDTSASKALLQAIMNSIRGTDATIAGKYSDLNSIKSGYDIINAYGTTDVGQVIAAYDGQNLYNAVYPQCRQVVADDCNDAALQRAINAYLMAIEQDCNTVQTAIEKKQSDLKSALREGSAMLDLARVENRQRHNAADFTNCMNNVETAVLSEEVCGAGYHKCLDNGQYIDISTGTPIKGVVEFYKLQELLTFSADVDAADQKLAKIVNNRQFVQNFESKTKKFAEPELDKCVDIADDVWSDYLDKAMLDIYYAQKSKVAEIKQGCFDFVSSCYMNTSATITDAMKDIIGQSALILQPDTVVLSGALCSDYVDSCNNMFNENIIAEYIDNRKNTDVLTACRAIVKQCFDSYGGTNYENFYYPYSGLFKVGSAPDWFTLYDDNGTYVSECAQQLQEVAACDDKDIIEQAFGGFDKFAVVSDEGGASAAGAIIYTKQADSNELKYFYAPTNDNLIHRGLRPTGVATEIYNQIIDILSTNCSNLGGKFIEYQNISFLRYGQYKDEADNVYMCKISSNSFSVDEINATGFGVSAGEDMCPVGYADDVDTESWGFCSCWENGHRRSQNGKSAKCVAALPKSGDTCAGATLSGADADGVLWCPVSGDGVCPPEYKWDTDTEKCKKKS